jgi:hypothetical protein
MKRFNSLVLLLILICVLLAGFFLGKYFTKQENQNLVLQNHSFVRTIAEMSSLEVNGVSTLKSSNVLNDGSFSDEMRRMFNEKSIWITIPYTAKFGVNLKNQDIQVNKEQNEVVVTLPEPEMLSLELKLDRMETGNRKGWLQFSNDDTYIAYQKKIYSDTKEQLTKDPTYHNQAKDKLNKIITEYYAPLNMKVTVQYQQQQLNKGAAAQ